MIGAQRAVLAVAKPKLPSADRVLPYLREIDAARVYANHGPLATRLEARLAESVRSERAESVCLAANATSALTAALAALELAPGSLCMLPAWTFAASAHAVVNAGLVPWFVDVNDDGALTPEAARAYLDTAPFPVGAILAVSPFGAPVPAGAWCDVRNETGIPVVIDAAAAFDSTRATELVAVVSLHATKVLGVGEGAFVASNDVEAVRAVRRRMNFGFAGTREARTPGLNAKMSEYAAAVGLAAVADWDETRSAFQRVATEYRHALRHVEHVRLQRGYGSAWVSATTIVRFANGRRDRVERALAAAGIATRRWWGEGAATHAAFRTFPRTTLPMTEALGSSTLGLPCWPDLPSDEIAHVAGVLAQHV